MECGIYLNREFKLFLVRGLQSSFGAPILYVVLVVLMGLYGIDLKNIGLIFYVFMVSLGFSVIFSCFLAFLIYAALSLLRIRRVNLCIVGFVVVLVSFLTGFLLGGLVGGAALMFAALSNFLFLTVLLRLKTSV